MYHHVTSSKLTSKTAIYTPIRPRRHSITHIRILLLHRSQNYSSLFTISLIHTMARRRGLCYHFLNPFLHYSAEWRLLSPHHVQFVNHYPSITTISIPSPLPYFSPWWFIIMHLFLIPLYIKNPNDFRIIFNYAMPSPRNRTFTDLPWRPTAWIVCGSSGTKSIAWSLHCTSSPSTSRIIPLIGFCVDKVMDSPSDPVVTFKPSSPKGGKVIYLKGSGLESSINLR